MGISCSMGMKLQFYKVSPRHLLYNIMPIVSNKVLCTYMRTDLMLSILTTKTTKQFQETLGNDGYVHYLDCGDGNNICAHIYPNSQNGLYFV